MLFPIFYVGYLIPLEKIEKMREQKWIFLVIGILSITVNLVLYRLEIVPISATHNYYDTIGELCIKYIYMLTTVGLFLFLNSWVPGDKLLCRWGRNSLIVYLLHPYFADVIGYLTRHYIRTEFISTIICLAASIIITWVLSLESIRNIYDSLMKKINRLLRWEVGAL